MSASMMSPFRIMRQPMAGRTTASCTCAACHAMSVECAMCCLFVATCCLCCGVCLFVCCLSGAHSWEESQGGVGAAGTNQQHPPLPPSCAAAQKKANQIGTWASHTPPIQVMV